MRGGKRGTDTGRRSVLPPKVRSFIDFLIERFGPDPYWDRGIG